MGVYYNMAHQDKEVDIYKQLKIVSGLQTLALMGTSTQIFAGKYVPLPGTYSPEVSFSAWKITF